MWKRLLGKGEGQGRLDWSSEQLRDLQATIGKLEARVKDLDARVESLEAATPPELTELVAEWAHYKTHLTRLFGRITKSLALEEKPARAELNGQVFVSAEDVIQFARQRGLTR